MLFPMDRLVDLAIRYIGAADDLLPLYSYYAAMNGCSSLLQEESRGSSIDLAFADLHRRLLVHPLIGDTVVVYGTSATDSC